MHQDIIDTLDDLTDDAIVDAAGEAVSDFTGILIWSLIATSAVGLLLTLLTIK